jgi:hypothetical protein
VKVYGVDLFDTPAATGMLNTGSSASSTAAASAVSWWWCQQQQQQQNRYVHCIYAPTGSANAAVQAFSNCWVLASTQAQVCICGDRVLIHGSMPESTRVCKLCHQHTWWHHDRSAVQLPPYHCYLCSLHGCACCRCFAFSLAAAVQLPA